MTGVLQDPVPESAVKISTVLLVAPVSSEPVLWCYPYSRGSGERPSSSVSILQTTDQYVGFAGAFCGEVLDLVVLHGDLAAEKSILAFELHDIARHVRTCRD